MTAVGIENSINYPFANHIETIVVFSILVFTYSSLIVFLSVIILRMRKNRYDKHAEIVKSSLNGILMSAAFASTDEELNDVLAKAKTEFSRQVKNSGMALVMIKE